MKKLLMSYLTVVLVITAGCSLFSKETIEQYNKERDEHFIENLVAQYPYEFAEGALFNDLNSPAVHAVLPDKNGIPAYAISYKQEVFTYVINEKPVGFIRIFEIFDEDKEARAEMDSVVEGLIGRGKNIRVIEEIGVAKEYQRKGIGEKLLRFAIEHMQQQGVQGAVLSVMSDSIARRLYERVGFSFVREIATEDTYWGAYCWYAIAL